MAQIGISHTGRQSINTSNVLSVIMFILLALSAYYFARKPLETGSRR